MANEAAVRIPSVAMLDDMHRVHAELGYINQQAYRDLGAYSDVAIRRRFGSWLKACEAAGLESRSHMGRNVIAISTKERRCLGTGPDHVFQARRDDPTHHICDACKGRTAPDPWDRIEVADGWEVVGA